MIILFIDTVNNKSYVNKSMNYISTYYLFYNQIALTF